MSLDTMLKVPFELLFYVALWGLWRSGISAWRRRFTSQSQLATTVAFVALWTALLMFAVAPYLLVGYGAPLLWAKEGPGTLSHATWYGTVPVWGPTLIYRFLVLWTVLPPLLFAKWILWFTAPALLDANAWLMVTVPWVFAAAAWSWENPPERRAPG